MILKNYLFILCCFNKHNYKVLIKNYFFKFIYRLNVNNTYLLFLNYLTKSQIIQKAFKLKGHWPLSLKYCWRYLKIFFFNFIYRLNVNNTDLLYC